MAAVEEEYDEDIVGESESSESDKNKNHPTYVSPTIKTGSSETEVVTIGSTYSTDYK